MNRILFVIEPPSVDPSVLPLCIELALSARQHVGRFVTMTEAIDFARWRQLPAGSTLPECLIDFVQYVKTVDACFLPVPGQDIGNREVVTITIPAKGLF